VSFYLLFCWFAFTNQMYRVDDDAALRSKVDEALRVYDDYMKSRSGEAGPNGTKEEEAPKAENAEATAA